ncbi:MAG: bile acid:sodium symporter [Opitutales bacterium]|nr:bile acid:sodium symporter [Opitutales bacterium]
MNKWIKQNYLWLSILLAVFFAWLTPEAGSRDGWLRTPVLTKIGIIFIFFTQGFKLSSSAIAQGIRFWQLHMFCQFWIFLGTPLLSLAIIFTIGSNWNSDLQTGIFFLSSLPTTITSAVIFVTRTGGNVAGAIFNTILANLVAVFILPTWILLYQKTTASHSFELLPVLWKLTWLILLPFAVGHLSQRWLSAFKEKVNRTSTPIHQGIIAMMIYSAFANSFHDNIWEEAGSSATIIALTSSVLLVAIFHSSVFGSSLLFFKKSDSRVSVFFIASQKSLAVGIPYSSALFAENPELGNQSVIILPLLFYHLLQLLLASILSNKLKADD